MQGADFKSKLTDVNKLRSLFTSMIFSIRHVRVLVEVVVRQRVSVGQRQRVPPQLKIGIDACASFKANHCMAISDKLFFSLAVHIDR